jgi:16S rRNA (guanine527-N7)-methyltransferase
MVQALRAPLQAGLATLDLPQAELAERLLAYLELLAKWNRAFNLTAVREPAEMLSRHLLDSLAILPWLRGGRLLDVGTGPGLPGIPLALARPELQVVLLDSNGKKTRFLRQVRLELGLDNVEVVEARVEAYAADAPFDIITSRAFAQLRDFVALTRPLLAPGGRWLAMKGRLDENELTALADEHVKLEIHRLVVPGLDAERHLIEIRGEPEH